MEAIKLSERELLDFVIATTRINNIGSYCWTALVEDLGEKLEEQPYAIFNAYKKLGALSIVEAILNLPPKYFRIFVATMENVSEINMETMCSLEELYKRKIQKTLAKAKNIDDFLKKIYSKTKNYSKECQKEDFSFMSRRDALREIFSEYVFADTYKNTFININIVSKFYLANCKHLSDTEKEPFEKLIEYKEHVYPLCYESNLDDVKNALKFYSQEDNKKVNLCLYEAMKIAREKSAEKYIKSLTPLKTLRKESKDGFKFYHIKPYEKFNFLIRTTNVHRKDIDPERAFDVEREASTLSTTYVTESSLVTYRNMNSFLTLGYFNLDPKEFIQITPYDNYNEYAINNKNSSFDFPQNFADPETIAHRSRMTDEYNEINILRIGEQHREELSKIYGKDFVDKIKDTKPDFILCLNGITEAEKEFSRKYNIPVVQIDNQRYKPVNMTLFKGENLYDRTY